jgi:hypothetical protein
VGKNIRYTLTGPGDRKGVEKEEGRKRKRERVSEKGERESVCGVRQGEREW